jgi:hypothetical protein
MANAAALVFPMSNEKRRYRYTAIVAPIPDAIEARYPVIPARDCLPIDDAGSRPQFQTAPEQGRTRVCSPQHLFGRKETS